MIPSDADLVRAVRHGDRDAFGALAERYRARAVGLAAAMLGDAGDAEDVVQEALYQAYFGIERLEDASRFGAWLCGIAVNLAKMALRRRRLTFSLDDLDGGRVAPGFRLEDTTPESEFETRELRNVVRRAIGQLPEDMRAAVWLHYVDGLSYQEIAALFGVAPGALRVQTHRARRKLRAALIGEWGKGSQRVEVKMIEITIHDVLVWAPADWQPEPAAVGALVTQPKRHVVLLKDQAGDRALPIWIGPAEAGMIITYLAEVPTVRPLTFDFMARLLDTAGLHVERVAVSALKGDTFFATVTVNSGGQAFEVDARPSDALNLALRVGAPVFVDADVMAQGRCVQVTEAPRELIERATQEGETLEEGYAWRSGHAIALAQKGAGK